MDLFITWDGLSGPDINYLVEYRPYPSTDTFTQFSSTVHDNYVTIPGLAQGYYEVKVSTVCSTGISGSIIKIGGQDRCAAPKFIDYSVVSENPSFANIQINYTGGSTLVKLRLTDLNTGTAKVFDPSVNLGTFTISLPKSTLAVKTYKIEILSICDGVDGSYVDMGSYSVERTVGVEIFYTNNCGTQVGTYTFTDSSNNVFVNPLSVHRDIYHLRLQMPLGSVQLPKDGQLKVEVFSNNQLFYTVETSVHGTSSGFDIPVGNLNLDHGALTGSYVQTLNLTFTCI